MICFLQPREQARLKNLRLIPTSLARKSPRCAVASNRGIGSSSFNAVANDARQAPGIPSRKLRVLRLEIKLMDFRCQVTWYFEFPFDEGAVNDKPCQVV
jgi:hypothetical protein